MLGGFEIIFAITLFCYYLRNTEFSSVLTELIILFDWRLISEQKYFKPLLSVIIYTFIKNKI